MLPYRMQVLPIYNQVRQASYSSVSSIRPVHHQRAALVNILRSCSSQQRHLSDARRGVATKSKTSSKASGTGTSGSTKKSNNKVLDPRQDDFWGEFLSRLFTSTSATSTTETAITNSNIESEYQVLGQEWSWLNGGYPFSIRHNACVVFILNLNEITHSLPHDLCCCLSLPFVFKINGDARSDIRHKFATCSNCELVKSCAQRQH
jgi:hypothetical protein